MLLCLAAVLVASFDAAPVPALAPDAAQWAMQELPRRPPPADPVPAPPAWARAQQAAAAGKLFSGDSVELLETLAASSEISHTLVGGFLDSPALWTVDKALQGRGLTLHRNPSLPSVIRWHPTWQAVLKAHDASAAWQLAALGLAEVIGTGEFSVELKRDLDLKGARRLLKDEVRGMMDESPETLASVSASIVRHGAMPQMEQMVGKRQVTGNVLRRSLELVDDGLPPGFQGVATWRGAQRILPRGVHCSKITGSETGNSTYLMPSSATCVRDLSYLTNVHFNTLERVWTTAQTEEMYIWFQAEMTRRFTSLGMRGGTDKAIGVSFVDLVRGILRLLTGITIRRETAESTGVRRTLGCDARGEFRSFEPAIPRVDGFLGLEPAPLQVFNDYRAWEDLVASRVACDEPILPYRVLVRLNRKSDKELKSKFGKRCWPIQAARTQVLKDLGRTSVNGAMAISNGELTSGGRWLYNILMAYNALDHERATEPGDVKTWGVYKQGAHQFLAVAVEQGMAAGATEEEVFSFFVRAMDGIGLRKAFDPETLLDLAGASLSIMAEGNPQKGPEERLVALFAESPLFNFAIKEFLVEQGGDDRGLSYPKEFQALFFDTLLRHGLAGSGSLFTGMVLHCAPAILRKVDGVDISTQPDIAGMWVKGTMGQFLESEQGEEPNAPQWLKEYASTEYVDRFGFALQRAQQFRTFAADTVEPPNAYRLFLLHGGLVPSNQRKWESEPFVSFTEFNREKWAQIGGHDLFELTVGQRSKWSTSAQSWALLRVLVAVNVMYDLVGYNPQLQMLAKRYLGWSSWREEAAFKQVAAEAGQVIMKPASPRARTMSWGFKDTVKGIVRQARQRYRTPAKSVDAPAKSFDFDVYPTAREKRKSESPKGRQVNFKDDALGNMAGMLKGGVNSLPL